MLKSSLLAAALLAGATATAAADSVVTGSVDAKPAKFLKDTIVYVKTVPGTKNTAQTFTIDQKNMEFAPHIVLAATGDTVKFTNSDKVDHNVMSPDAKYDLGTKPGGSVIEHVFKEAGVFSQVCKIHPEMLAYVFVGQNRYASTVDDKGNFKIAGLPAGSYELDVWNPKLKAPAQTIKVTADGASNIKFSLTR